MSPIYYAQDSVSTFLKLNWTMDFSPFPDSRTYNPNMNLMISPVMQTQFCWKSSQANKPSMSPWHRIIKSNGRGTSTSFWIGSHFHWLQQPFTFEGKYVQGRIINNFWNSLGSIFILKRYWKQTFLSGVWSEVTDNIRDVWEASWKHMALSWVCKKMMSEKKICRGVIPQKKKNNLWVVPFKREKDF